MRKCGEVSKDGRAPFTLGGSESRENSVPLGSKRGSVRTASVRPRSRADVPDVSRRQRAVDDLVKQLRKLRWMGFRNDASQLQQSRETWPAVDGALTKRTDSDA